MTLDPQPAAGFTIRAAVPGDAAELAALHVRCWHETYRGLVPDALLERFSPDHGRAVWGRILADPPAYHATAVYLALHRAQFAGFVACGAQRSPALAARAFDGEISAIYVARAFQRRGAGMSLLAHAAGDLIGRGCGAASLWVLRDNAPARAFYARCGGAVIDERRDVRDSAVLEEVAYGWAQLAALGRLTES